MTEEHDDGDDARPHESLIAWKVAQDYAPAPVARVHPCDFLDPEAPGFARDLQALADAPELAFDLEANAFHRYFERVCLLQLGLPESSDPGGRTLLFDPQRHAWPERLVSRLSSKAKRLVVHGADFDVRLMKADPQIALGRLFDTYLAARVLGRPQVGLKALLETELGVTIDKGAQRSDWGKRPLTDDQIGYACADVAHLLPLAERLEEALVRAGRRAWHEEECALLAEVEPTVKVFDPEDWRRVKGSQTLGARGRKALAALFAFRDDRARAEDQPPVRVARNDVLFRVARSVDRSEERLVRLLRTWSFVPARIDRAEWAEVIERALKGRDPGRRRPAKRTASPKAEPGLQERIEGIRAVRSRFSTDLGLDPGFLLPSQLLARVARAAPCDRAALRSVPGMTAWRAEVLGAAMLDVLDREESAR